MNMNIDLKCLICFSNFNIKCLLNYDLKKYRDISLFIRFKNYMLWDFD